MYWSIHFTMYYFMYRYEKLRYYISRAKDATWFLASFPSKLRSRRQFLFLSAP